MKLMKLFPAIALLLAVLTVGCKKDDEPGTTLTVMSTDPVDKATHIPVNSKVSATFNVAMDPATITIGTFTLQAGLVTVSGVTTTTGTTATFIPAWNLTTNTTYTATITTGVKDVAGKTIDKDFTWSFTTSAISDITPPTVILTDPAGSATGITLNHLVAVTFSEPVDPATITLSTFTLMEGTTAVQGTVHYTGSTATFTPSLNLSVNKVYTATITNGVKDMAGNALASNYVFSFTTGDAQDIIAPLVNSTDPLNNADGVLRNKVVALTFSEAMDPFTVNTSTFTLKQGNTLVSGTVAYSGTTARFTPSAILAAGTTYTATIATGAKDLAGNALAAATVWSFTTGSAIMPLAKVDLGSAGNYVILAKTAISNISPSAITGDLALSPAATSYITGLALTNGTGYATSSQVTGKVYAADMASPTPVNLTTAVNDMITAYNDAAGRPFPDFSELGTGNIGGKTLTPGLYKWSSTVSLPTDITISGGADDVWIFQISGDLTASSAVKVTLNGGAQAKNIFWQVAGQATLGTTSHFEGVVLSMTAIVFQTGASINGRALAQTAVVLDASTVTKP